MYYNAEQIIDGITRYADNEIMVKLPTSGKWVFGTVFNVASKKVDSLIDNLKSNSVVSMLGIVDENGNIDVDTVIISLKESATKYGNISVDVPLVGKMTFSATDIDALRNYIG